MGSLLLYVWQQAAGIEH